jgi:hypothetical protein
MSPEQQARAIGMIVGAIAVGIICGLVPLIFGLKKQRVALAWAGFAASAAGGFILGLLGAIPMAAIFSGWIAMSGSAKPKKRVATAPRIRTPIDVPEI